MKYSVVNVPYCISLMHFLTYLNPATAISNSIYSKWSSKSSTLCLIRKILTFLFTRIIYAEAQKLRLNENIIQHNKHTNTLERASRAKWNNTCEIYWNMKICDFIEMRLYNCSVHETTGWIQSQPNTTKRRYANWIY